MTRPTVQSPQLGVADDADVRRRAQEAVACTILELEKLLGGASGITYLARHEEGSRTVVKVAPPGLEPVRNRDVLRQARLLAALAGVPGLAVPQVLGTDPGDPPEVPPLFVMSFAEGESHEPRHATGPGPDAATVYARATAAASMLAALHATDPAALGIDEPVVGLAREADRWRKALASCALAPATAATEQRCHDLLLARVPEPVRPAVLHGDWRLGNMLCRGASIQAVIDWEIWSVGDPRLDLAWMRLMHDPDHPTATTPDAPAPGPDELLAHYRAAGGSAEGLAWFDAVVRYKQAAASALLVKNADKRGESSPRIERMRAGVDLLLHAALDRLG